MNSTSSSGCVGLYPSHLKPYNHFLLFHYYRPYFCYVKVRGVLCWDFSEIHLQTDTNTEQGDLLNWLELFFLSSCH